MASPKAARAMYLIIWFRAREAVEMILERCAQGAERGHLLYCNGGGRLAHDGASWRGVCG